MVILEVSLSVHSLNFNFTPSLGGKGLGDAKKTMHVAHSACYHVIIRFGRVSNKYPVV